MHVDRRDLAAEKTRELDLPAGRRQQIHAANDQVDALAPVVHGDRELIRPVAEPVANQHVAALLRRRLFLPAEQRIFEHLDTRRQAHAPAEAVGQRQVAIAARAGIFQLATRVRRGAGHRQRTPCAVAGVDQSPVAQPAQCLVVDGLAVALASITPPRAEHARGIHVGHELQPVEIVEDAAFVLRPAALAVVILDSQHDPAAGGARRVPHVEGVEHVAEMQPSGRSRRETRQRRRQRTGRSGCPGNLRAHARCTIPLCSPPSPLSILSCFFSLRHLHAPMPQHAATRRLPRPRGRTSRRSTISRGGPRRRAGQTIRN